MPHTVQSQPQQQLTPSNRHNSQLFRQTGPLPYTPDDNISPAAKHSRHPGQTNYPPPQQHSNDAFQQPNQFQNISAVPPQGQKQWNDELNSGTFDPFSQRVSEVPPSDNENFSLLGYFKSSTGPNTSTTQNQRNLSTEMTDAGQTTDRPPPILNDGNEVSQATAGDELEDDDLVDDDDDDDDDDDLQTLKESMSKTYKQRMEQTNSRLKLLESGVGPSQLPDRPDPGRSFGSWRNGSGMDISQAIGLSIGSGVLRRQSEEGDLLPYYGDVKSRSRSTSDRKLSIDSRMQSDGNMELGQRYYTREPSAALQRLSGSIKFNGRWSGTMSDILGADDSNGSAQGLMSLFIPEVGGTRGSYSNSVSPLGMTVTTPCASPRTAIAYTHRGFASPRNSFSMLFEKFPMPEIQPVPKDTGG